MKKLAVILSHPIQYYAPLFKLASTEIDLVVLYCFNPSPEQQGAAGFNKAFEWDIDLFSGYDYEFLMNAAKEPSSANFNGCNTPHLGARLKALEVSHVICFGWHLKSFHQAARYCRKNNIPIAVRGDSQVDPNQIWYKRLIKKMTYPLMLKKFDFFLTVGKRNTAYLKKFGLKPEQIIHSPHAVNQEFWKAKGAISKEFDPCTFLWVAKMIPKKRPMDLIEAFLIALQENDSMRLKVVGTGPMEIEMRQRAQGIKEIEFLGFKNQGELIEVYEKSNALILTSDYRETWGLVVNEAFSMGLPAIVSDACGCAADLINENTGKLYSLGDTKELSKQMLALANEMKEKTNLSRMAAGIELQNRKFSYDKIIESFKMFLAAK